MKKIISGKVREVYEISDDKLVIITTDRISAFDVILPKPVEGKGKVLNAVSLFWFDFTKDIVPNHIISSNLADMPEYFQKDEFEGRAVLVKKLKMLPFEFVVRGYVFGNMWEAYSQKKEFCGHMIEGDYKLAEKLAAPIFTPSTKAHVGHDVYISSKDVADAIGDEMADRIEKASLKLYETCYNHAYGKGIIIADTKFEFGLDENGNVVLADEIFTPDSSRFWSLDDYKVGTSPKSFDKQFVRDWLQNNKIGGEMQFNDVPDDVLAKTSEVCAECLRIIVEKRAQND
ncbi:MAG: phosphoribosylaminoimidazolesuccinocarboxamide synthase [Oscillospiraceae bacterium]|jgi:phosphoribosylaminoimidazole-succinocarboxamide synthase|nr:phosphoribosylaminoimidazolesuccinocarboxamide synthase [Oscillospiraceae bacterium]